MALPACPSEKPAMEGGLSTRSVEWAAGLGLDSKDGQPSLVPEACHLGCCRRERWELAQGSHGEGR